MAKPIGTLGVIDTLTVGGRVFTDLTNLIILGTNPPAGKYESVYAANSSAAYQVTNGKTLTIYAYRIQMIGTTNGDGASDFLYGDTSVTNSNTPPTNAVFAFNTKHSIVGSYTTTENVLNFAIPSQKYLHILNNNSVGSSLYTIFGYET